jgi:hypothetical protein
MDGGWPLVNRQVCTENKRPQVQKPFRKEGERLGKVRRQSGSRLKSSLPHEHHESCSNRETQRPAHAGHNTRMMDRQRGDHISVVRHRFKRVAKARKGLVEQDGHDLGVEVLHAASGASEQDAIRSEVDVRREADPRVRFDA